MIALQPVQPVMEDDTQFFIVRVWRHLSQFRASVRRVDADEPCLCTSPEQVAQVIGSPPGADNSACPGLSTPPDPRRTP